MVFNPFATTNARCACQSLMAYGRLLRLAVFIEKQTGSRINFLSFPQETKRKLSGMTEQTG
jgi:hypothetical protein